MDLGSPRTIDRVVLNWGVASAKAYRLEASADGKAWKKIASRSGMAPGIREDELAGLKAKARYLRLFCTARTTGATQYSLRELRAYAVAAPAAEPEAQAASSLASSPAPSWNPRRTST